MLRHLSNCIWSRKFLVLRWLGGAAPKRQQGIPQQLLAFRLHRDGRGGASNRWPYCAISSCTLSRNCATSAPSYHFNKRQDYA